MSADGRGLGPVEGGRLWRGGRRGLGRRPRPRRDRRLRQWDPQWDAIVARHRVVALRPARLRTRRRHRDPVLQPRRPGRGDGRRRTGPGGARRLLAGGADRHRHGARAPGPGVRRGLGLRRDLAASRPEEHAGGDGGVRARARRSRRRRTGRRRTTTSGSGSTGSASPRDGRPPRRARPSGDGLRDATCRRSRTATRSCSIRPRSAGSASCASRCSRSRAGWTSPRPGPRRRARGRRARRAADPPPGCRPHAQPRAARVVHRDPAGVPGDGRLAPLRRAARSPHQVTRSIATRMIGRSSSAWSRYCGCLSRSRATAAS